VTARPGVALALAALAFALGACDSRDERAERRASNTAVLGGFGAPPAATVDPAGQAPAPPAPRGSKAVVAAGNEETTLALWDEQGRVMASRHTRAGGWEQAVPLEDIAGDASNLRLAGNRNGVAMAIWQHTVGSIESLRYSRWEEATGWTPPDVMPGALPRATQPGKTAGNAVDAAAVELDVDALGNARAQWRSGFDASQLQASTFVPGEGWSRAIDLPVAAAPAPR
jgi:hypothetical protein